MIRSIRGDRAQEVSTPLKSVDEGDAKWYLPVLNRAYAENGDLLWTFVVELYRIPEMGEIITIANAQQN